MFGEDELHDLIVAAGLEDVPLACSIRIGDQGLDWTQGTWTGGLLVARDDRFYAASLSKQVTAAAIAILVRGSDFDVDASLGDILPELPDWRHNVSTRHLLYHLGGLPEVGVGSGPGHRTTVKVLEMLRQSPALATVPGTAFHYSNAGYVCLATIAERVSAMPFAQFARATLFDPLHLADLDFLADEPLQHPQLAGMGDVLPLSLGDGGLWTSAAAFADWLDHQNRDTLGIAALVQQPGRLNDGTATDYCWGIGIRTLADRPLFIHGGGWPGAHSKAIRSPALDLSVVALAAADTDAGVISLVDAVTQRLAKQRR